MKTWETINGDEIPYKKLEDSHLLNILKFIERRAKDGIECCTYGYDGDDDYMTGEVWTIYGDEVLERYDYKGLKKEAKKRKLIK